MGLCQSRHREEPVTSIAQPVDLPNSGGSLFVAGDKLVFVPCSRSEWRHYAVWAIRGRDDLRGVWSGPHPKTWDTLSALPLARWKRVPSLEEAVAGYSSLAPSRSAPLPCPLFVV